MRDQLLPKWIYRFLLWFVAEELQEEVCGDLIEAYRYRLKSHPKWKTDLWFIADVLRFFRPHSFEKYSRTKQYIPMIKNYFKIALRNIIKRKGFTVLNVSGLAISLSVVLLVGLFLSHHLSYDLQLPDSERIYRLENEYRSQSYAPFRFTNYYNSDRNDQLQSREFLKTFSWVDEVVYVLPSNSTISNQPDYVLELDDRKYTTGPVLFTSTPESFISVFAPEFLNGTTSAFIGDFQKILLTANLANSIFGTSWQEMDLIGKRVNMEVSSLESANYTIVGVVANPPANSNFNYELIVSTPRIPSWAAYTYFKTSQPIQASQLTSRINDRYAEIEPNFGQDERYEGVYVQELSDIHTSDRTILYEPAAKISKNVLTLFGIVALVILIITWTNYMNLSIAIYSRRQKEIGIRKVMGAEGRDIVFQLLTEIVLISLLAFPLAMLMVHGVLPSFNYLMSISIPTNMIWSPIFAFGILGVAVFTGLLSGIYPAIVFSKRNLLALFKSKINTSPGRFGFGLRRVLIGVQFVLLISMLSLTGFVYQQMVYINEKNLGFEENGVISIPTAGREQHTILRSRLKTLPQIDFVGSGSIPGTDPFNQTTYKVQGKEEVFDDAHVIYAEREVMRAIGVEHPVFNSLTEGKRRVHLINQSLAQKLMKTYTLSETELIGMTLIDEPEYTDPETGQVGFPRVIEGILPDINYFSLRYEVNPMMFLIDREQLWAYNTVIKIKEGEELPQVIGLIEDAYYEAGNTQPFSVDFLDQNLDQLYQRDQQVLWLISTLSLVAIFLGVMGLIGLVSYLVYTRQKEISIRKIFGASVGQIMLLMNKEFAILMFLALLIATPIVYQLAQNWLENFAYRITINPFLIVLAAFGTLLIVGSVVSFLSQKAAHTNPTDVLYEE